MLFHSRRDSYYVYLDDQREDVESDECGDEYPYIKSVSKGIKTKRSPKRRPDIAKDFTIVTTKRPDINHTSKETCSSAFVPQRSSRTSAVEIQNDGDTWIEIPVNLGKKNTAVANTNNSINSNSTPTRSRSLFYSVKTQAGVWDEPPTGASNIIYQDQLGTLSQT
mmetsp:Transcript_3594/g.5343  ORF Transcript_3594/g.5343 Transcript_3594/m.5343 type:complete len:165 (+) Transcript_3594:116-610(+)